MILNIEKNKHVDLVILKRENTSPIEPAENHQSSKRMETSTMDATLGVKKSHEENHLGFQTYCEDDKESLLSLVEANSIEVVLKQKCGRDGDFQKYFNYEQESDSSLTEDCTSWGSDSYHETISILSEVSWESESFYGRQSVASEDMTCLHHSSLPQSQEEENISQMTNPRKEYDEIFSANSFVNEEYRDDNCSGMSSPQPAPILFFRFFKESFRSNSL